MRLRFLLAVIAIVALFPKIVVPVSQSAVDAAVTGIQQLMANGEGAGR